MTGSITALFLKQLWQEYSRNPSFGGLHGEERDHAVADVVVVEGLLHPLTLLHHRRRLRNLARHEELAPERKGRQVSSTGSFELSHLNKVVSNKTT